jgi:DNA-3-methyladenine glycosylase
MRYARATTMEVQVIRKKSASIVWPGTPLSRTFFDRDASTVAPQLLNKILAAADGRSGRIVEVEAYMGAVDPAAHTYRGETPRNATMFGPSGHMYVYFTYGMHWCCNCVCGPEGEGSGVLIRALEPLHGIEQMRAARPRIVSDRDLCRGPARLTQAMGISGAQNGIDLVSAGDGFTIVDDGVTPPKNLVGGPRIGISLGKDFPWRWRVPGSRYVSGTAAQRG